MRNWLEVHTTDIMNGATTWLIALYSLSLLISEANGYDYLPIPFNTSHSFGPDGPWQGVSISVQYALPGEKVQHVTLLPTTSHEINYGAAWIPNTLACDKNPDKECGSGGLMTIPPNGPAGTSGYTYFISDGPGGWVFNITASIWAQANLVLAPGLEMDKAWIGSINHSYVRYPSGLSTGLELGYFMLGGYGSNERNSAPRYAYQNSFVKSNSFGMHIGAAALDYPGSLILGGYDKGRVIGPLISNNAGSVAGAQLIDIIIGVETGQSPFPFGNASNLLVSGNTPAPQPLSAQVVPDHPYVELPHDTVGKITSKLPVYFDDKCGYYLWNTTDPDYKRIVKSPAYLGFVFPDTASSISHANITIKVPFMLLNLTLETSASGLESDVPYLPIVIGGSPYRKWKANAVILGRAFLQAAFLCIDWNTNMTRLAQAPGPGSSREGLGFLPRELSPGARTLDVETGGSLFRDSWEGYWTPIESKSSQNTNSPTPHHSNSGLGGGAIAGIIIGVIAFVVIVAAIVFLLWQRRKRLSENTESGNAPRTGEQQPVVSELESPMLVQAEIARSKELDGGCRPQELSGRWEPSELHGNARPPEGTE